MFCQCPANKALPLLIKSSIPKRILPNPNPRRHASKEWRSARFAPCGQLPPSPSGDGMLTFSPSPSIKDHLIKMPSPVLNKISGWLLAVSWSHLCSSSPYFRFVLLCWFRFLTQTSRLKNGQKLYLVKLTYWGNSKEPLGSQWNWHLFKYCH